MVNTAVKTKDERYDVDTHFGFGENWADYAQHIGDFDIQKAEEGLHKLIAADDLKDKSFLDIGCGSGLHSLAALRSGVKNLTAVDFDPNSVATTEKVLAAHWNQDNYILLQHNILEKPHQAALKDESFDVVYSWGVLHHTGDMWSAIDNAAQFVAPGGTFIIALYKKTKSCGFWAQEKKLYTSIPKWTRFPFDYAYALALSAAKLIKGQNPIAYIRDYREQRGMRFMIDVKDWLGGYPYESATPEEVKEFLEPKGFTLVDSHFAHDDMDRGLFGSGCSEYVFQKK